MKIIFPGGGDCEIPRQGPIAKYFSLIAGFVETYGDNSEMHIPEDADVTYDDFNCAWRAICDGPIDGSAAFATKASWNIRPRVLRALEYFGYTFVEPVGTNSDIYLAYVSTEMLGGLPSFEKPFPVDQNANMVHLARHLAANGGPGVGRIRDDKMRKAYANDIFRRNAEWDDRQLGPVASYEPRHSMVDYRKIWWLLRCGARHQLPTTAYELKYSADFRRLSPEDREKIRVAVLRECKGCCEILFLPKTSAEWDAVIAGAQEDGGGFYGDGENFDCLWKFAKFAEGLPIEKTILGVNPLLTVIAAAREGMVDVFRSNFKALPKWACVFVAAWLVLTGRRDFAVMACARRRWYDFSSLVFRALSDPSLRRRFPPIELDMFFDKEGWLAKATRRSMPEMCISEVYCDEFAESMARNGLANWESCGCICNSFCLPHLTPGDRTKYPVRLGVFATAVANGDAERLGLDDSRAVILAEDKRMSELHRCAKILGDERLMGIAIKNRDLDVICKLVCAGYSWNRSKIPANLIVDTILE